MNECLLTLLFSQDYLVKLTSMTVYLTHATVEPASTETIHLVVNVTLDTQVIFARHRSMSASRIHVSTMAIAKISLEAIDVAVYQELLAPIVKLMSTNVTATHVEMELRALMASTSTRVNVCQDTPEFIVKPTSMNANLIHVPTEASALTW
jgi:hypothetical protein